MSNTLSPAAQARGVSPLPALELDSSDADDVEKDPTMAGLHETGSYTTTAYRWIVLASVVPILMITQMYWLTFSAIAPQSQAYYHTTPLAISALSMSYMVAFVVFTLPASLLADRRGLRACFLIGALITAVFGVMRGYVASSFPLVVVSQLGLAVAQPFVVNPITKLAAQWFPVDERATVSGIGSVAGYVGLAVAMVVTPMMHDVLGMEGMLQAMGWMAVIVGLPVVFLLRERPDRPAGPSVPDDGRFSIRDVWGLRANRNFVMLLVIVMIALGAFNAVLTCLSDMLLARGIDSERAGVVGAVIIVAGIVGGVVYPLLSDKAGRRRPFIILATAASLLPLAGLFFLGSFPLLIVCAAVAGFLLMGAGPLIFEYGTEEGYPVPEGTTYGLMMASGQISGLVFILMVYGLQGALFGDDSMTLPMLLLMAVMLVATLMALRVRESRIVGMPGAR